jgi:predicted MFS family arabinose efflux permease
MSDTHLEATPIVPSKIRSILTRDFVLCFVAFFAFLMAVFALIPTLPIFLARLGMNETEIGVIVGVYGVSSLVARLLVGGALLRFPERTVMMAGALLFGLSFVALVLFRDFWPLAMIRLLQGVCFAAIDTAALAFAFAIIPVAQRSRAIGYFVLAPPFAQATAPAIAMFLVNHYDFMVVFLGCAGLSVCAFLFSVRLPARRDPPTTDGAARRVRFLDVKVIPPAIPTFLHGVVWGSIMAFLPLYALQSRIANPGFYFSAVGVMLIVGRAFGGKVLDTCRKELILMYCMSMLTIAMLVLSFSGTLVTFVVVGLLYGCGAAFFFPTAMAYAFEYAGSSDGAAVGTFRALADFGVAVGPTIMGVILPATGYRFMFLLLAALFLASLIYFRFFLTKKSPSETSSVI